MILQVEIRTVESKVFRNKTTCGNNEWVAQYALADDEARSRLTSHASCKGKRVTTPMAR